MNYQKIYNQLIEKRKNNKPTEYFQKHHIKPRSIFPELINDKNNIICLTYRQHYIAHWLLTKIYTNNSKMIFAFWRMNCCQNSLYVNSNIYASIRKQTIDILSKERKGKYTGISNPHYGKHHSIETKQLISKLKTGTHVSQNVKQKIRETTGKKVLCIQTNLIYLSTRHVQEKLNIYHSYISRCCRGKRETAGGYHWKYL